MLNIRLARTGRKRDAHFRVVVADALRGKVGRIVETVGHYHPRLPSDAEGRVQLDTERTSFWIGKGARPTDAVRKLLRQVASAA